MAQVARNRQTRPDVDYHLDYQFGQWEDVPEYAARWPTMEGIDRETVYLEWQGITESRLAELRKWAERDLLTPAQRARYAALLALVARQRPVLEALFAGDGRAGAG